MKKLTFLPCIVVILFLTGCPELPEDYSWIYGAWAEGPSFYNTLTSIEDLYIYNDIWVFEKNGNLSIYNDYDQNFLKSKLTYSIGRTDTGKLVLSFRNNHDDIGCTYLVDSDRVACVNLWDCVVGDCKYDVYLYKKSLYPKCSLEGSTLTVNSGWTSTPSIPSDDSIVYQVSVTSGVTYSIQWDSVIFELYHYLDYVVVSCCNVDASNEYFSNVGYNTVQQFIANDTETIYIIIKNNWGHQFEDGYIKLQVTSP